MSTELVKPPVEIKFGNISATLKPVINELGLKELHVEIDTPDGKLTFLGEETEDGKITLKGETSRETFVKIAETIKEKRLALKFLDFIQTTFNRNVLIGREFGSPEGFSRILPERF